MDKYDAIDQQYLLNEQYRDASNFNARIQAALNVNPGAFDWYTWVFKHMQERPDLRVLELGCGPGYLWLPNLRLIPPGWDITLSDFSPGMIAEAQNNLAQSKQPFAFQVIDAQDIPYEAASFDILIAHLMLYHVPDRARAFAEVRRVLKPGGVFYAGTISTAVLAEFGKLMGTAGMEGWQDVISFTLENGTEELAPWFSHIEVQRLTVPLSFPSAEPLLAFIQSALPPGKYDATTLQFLAEVIRQELARSGEIRINTEMGVFIAS